MTDCVNKDIVTLGCVSNASIHLPDVPNTFSYATSTDDLDIDCDRNCKIISMADPMGRTPTCLHNCLMIAT